MTEVVVDIKCCSGLQVGRVQLVVKVLSAPSSAGSVGHSLNEARRNNLHCDVVLRVQDKDRVQDFPAHRAVLCSHSPVFCKMLGDKSFKVSPACALQEQSYF